MTTEDEIPHVEVKITVMVGSEEFTFLDEGFGSDGADMARIMLNSLKIVACRALGFPSP